MLVTVTVLEVSMFGSVCVCVCVYVSLSLGRVVLSAAGDAAVVLTH